MVADFICPDLRTWNIPLLSNSFDEHQVAEILKVHISPHYTEDKLIWTGRLNGEYTVKNGYHRINSATTTILQHQPSSSFQTPKHLWATIWKVPAPPKLRIFLWSLCHNAIATAANLYYRHIIADPICQLCRDSNPTPETTEHLFLHCSWTKKVWTHAHLPCPIQHDQHHRFEAWLLHIFDKEKNLQFYAQIAYVLWHIWKARNDFIFRRRPPNPDHIVVSALAHARSYHRCHQTGGFDGASSTSGFQSAGKPIPRRLPLDLSWCPPPPGKLKINIDASFPTITDGAAVSCLCRDSSGKLIDGSAHRTLSVSPRRRSHP